MPALHGPPAGCDCAECQRSQNRRRLLAILKPMVSLVVHAILGLVLIGLIVASNPKIFARPANGPRLSALECAYYAIGIAGTVLGYYFNTRFVAQYATGTGNIFWGPGSWAEFISLGYQSGRQQREPGLHAHQRRAASIVHDRRRIPARHPPPWLLLRDEPVHQLCIRVRLLLRDHGASAPPSAGRTGTGEDGDFRRAAVGPRRRRRSSSCSRPCPRAIPSGTPP